MKTIYRIKERAGTPASNMHTSGALRVSVLADELIRLEWSPSRTFTDKPTQGVWFRDFGRVPFFKQELDGETVIETAKVRICCKLAKSLREAVCIRLKNPVADWNVITGLKDSWRYGDKLCALPGTARTLDNCDGETALEDGIISRSGFSLLDDSRTCIIEEDGSVMPRTEEDSLDVYFFCYGHDYTGCLAAYLKLTGLPPLLPRYALGNWWSRYHKYTQQEYLDLMETFAKKNIPLSVAMIDMDWHITQIDKAIGSGWTGYTWNRDLFPDPKAFLEELHKKGLKISLNVHPAEGVGRHEAAYKAMTASMGLPCDGNTVPFDFTDSKFVESYFECLHAPLEKEGVDFWWIDWQQGTQSLTAGLDPLWLLNHYHYLDNAKSGKRPLILSRYAGHGSQRYPVGFSGDTVISWKSLAFQPYFTSCASNIGYGWWSHDIGGHMLGSFDEELQVRWVQLGVFSPIMRLHSSASPFNHKEPWSYEKTEFSIIKRYMIMRHRLIPYLYTMNERFSKTGTPLVEPLYYRSPEEADAYTKPNEYYFGTELIVAPVTSPVDKSLQRAAVPLWLPEGVFTDIFTGVSYRGERSLTMYRPLQDIPVLLKEGGILPLASSLSVEQGETLPSSFDIYLACSPKSHTENSFTLYEDDGESLEYQKEKFATTKFSFATGNRSSLTIHAAQGDIDLLPKRRSYSLHFMNCNPVEKCRLIKEDGKEELSFSYDPLKREVLVKVDLAADEEVTVCLHCASTATSVRADRCFCLLDKARIDFAKKEDLFSIVKANEENPLVACQQLIYKKADINFTEALLELLENL